MSANVQPPAPLPKHRAAKIGAVHGKRAKLNEKRQQVLDLGAHSLALLTEITHREPQLSGQVGKLTVAGVTDAPGGRNRATKTLGSSRFR